MLFWRMLKRRNISNIADCRLEEGITPGLQRGVPLMGCSKVYALKSEFKPGKKKSAIGNRQ